VFEIAPPDGAELNLSFTPKVTVSPDGSMVAFAAAANGESHLYVRRRDSVTARQLPGTEDARHPVFSPNGTWIAFFAANALKKVPLEGPVVLLTKVNNDARGLAWADGASLVYAPGAASGLMQISADGGEPKSLTVPDTANRQIHWWPCAVPGGKAVLYTVGQTNNQNNDNLSAIEAVTLATGERRTVLQGASVAVYVTAGHLLFTRGDTLHAVPFDAERLATTGAVVPVVQDVMDVGTGAAHVSVGGDGTLAYIPSTRNTLHRIAWLDPDGTARPVDLAPAQYNDLKISPDGARVAFSQQGKGVWVYDLQRKSLTRLTPGQRDMTPAWSADGRTLYYVYVDQSGGNTRFLRKPADGSRGPEPVAVIKHAGYLSEVLADGAAAIIELNVRTANTDLHSDIARIRLAPGNTDTITPTNIEATQADESAADVSPDERWMAYQSDENGTRHEVYVRDLSGSGGRWQISNAGGEEPYLSPDARRLYYRNDDALYAVAVDTRNDFSAGAPQFLFRGVDNTRNDGPRYTVDPKTGRLLMLRPATGQQTRHTIRVVLNWFEELNAKLQQAR